jgi:hypothetical protein
MVVVTNTLTIGQLVFILRVAIQVFTYAGPLVIGLVTLSHTPRLASFGTHDLLNRIIGKLSSTEFSALWIWHRIRRTNRDPIKSLPLTTTIVFVVLCSLFTSLSDIGFLGFYACAVEGTAQFDRPGSIRDEQHARTVVLSNFINGSNPNNIPAYRCNSSSIYRGGPPDRRRPLYECVEWHSSTWLDRTLFTGINTTDSDGLMPRSLGRYLGAFSNMTSFHVNVGTKKIRTPSIENGILVNPTATGFQAVFGVPDITPDHEFTLEKAMALEVEVGCMTLGIHSVKAVDGPMSTGPTFFQTNDTWRKYSGPDILYDVLSNWTDAMREYSLPLFNTSTLDSNGLISSLNRLPATFTDITYVDRAYLPANSSDGYGDQDWFIQGCANSVRERLGLPAVNATDEDSFTCSLLGISGSIPDNGKLVQMQTKMLCASVPQINMVSATIQSDSKSSISLDLSRIPSDLHYLRADYWETQQVGMVTQYTIWEPIERFTLSENNNGAMSHYIIQHRDSDNSMRLRGPGSAGNILTRAGFRAINPTPRRTIQTLDETGEEVIFSPVTMTQWAGQVGSSIILASLQYNPWVALEAPLITLARDTGDGPTAICYHTAYALGFLPLALVTAIVLLWFLITLTRTSFRQLRHRENQYGGLYSYWKSVCPDLRPQDILLTWKRYANPHLDVYSSQKHAPIERDAATAVDYLDIPD